MLTACRAKLAQTHRAATTGLPCSHDRPDPSKAKRPPPPPDKSAGHATSHGGVGQLESQLPGAGWYG